MVDDYFKCAPRSADDFLPIDGIFPFEHGDAVGTMRQYNAAIALQKLFPLSRVSCWRLPSTRGPWSDVEVVGESTDAIGAMLVSA